MVRYSHVFISTQNLEGDQKEAAKERAEEIYREIRNGEITFAEAVVKYSDDTNSRYKGGDVGYLPRNNPQLISYFGETFVETLFELEIGEISDVVTSNLGYHIIRKTEHRDKKFLELSDPLSPLDDTTVRQGIRQQLMQQAQASVLNQAVNEVVADLREKAEITVYEDRLSW
jgi:parvulin-like peptidyl-prolyl isomerase